MLPPMADLTATTEFQFVALDSLGTTRQTRPCVA